MGRHTSSTVELFYSGCEGSKVVLQWTVYTRPDTTVHQCMHYIYSGMKPHVKQSGQEVMMESS